MAIWINQDSKIIVQGITGEQGTFHTQRMLEYGTQVVAGVVPGKGGSFWEYESSENGKTVKHKIPVFHTMEKAVKETSADVSCIMVPKNFAADAALEAISQGMEVIVVITEGIPINEMVTVHGALKNSLSVMIGPNCPGIVSAGECKVGIMPGHIFTPGSVGLISRSGTLTYEVVWALTQAGLGQSTCIGIGGDPIIGSTFLEHLIEFNDDDQTQTVVLIGEIGGTDEEEAAEYIADAFDKPVIAFISGQTAPKGKRMGHAGAIVSGNTGTVESKIQAFKKADVPIANTISEIVELTRIALGGK